MAKGDQITVVLRGQDTPIIVEAEKAGRVLVTDDEKANGIQWMLVHEKTWTGKTKKTTRFAAGDVVAMISNFEEGDA